MPAAGGRADGVLQLRECVLDHRREHDYQHLTATSAIPDDDDPTVVGLGHELLRGDSLVAGELCTSDDPCPLSGFYTTGNFLAWEVPLIESSPAFGSDGVIVVTYDEDQRMGGLATKNGLGSGGHIACALISPFVQPGEYADKTYAYTLLPHDPGQLGARAVPRLRRPGGTAP